MKGAKLGKQMKVALACVVLLFGQVSPVSAAMVSTTSALQQERLSVDRAALTEMLERQAVTDQLRELGVEPDDAKVRVAAMTDEEIRQLNQHLAEMPAGGHDVLGVLLLLFIIFVITDMLGATDIFPFVHSINK